MKDEDTMGFFDRLFGTDDQGARPAPPAAPSRAMSDDERAIERYRYLLRTAPPEAIEQVHAEAFAKLTPAQREQVYRALAQQAPAGERVDSDDPNVMARAATRQELRQPGSMERAFATAGAAPGGPGAGQRGGPSFGTMFGGSLLGTITGVVLGSAIASAILPPVGVDGGTDAGGDGGTDAGGDPGSVDAAGADASGGDGGFFGGDFGGGDFGGGEFGGGDFGF